MEFSGGDRSSAVVLLPLRMMEVLKQRKRKRRLSVDVQEANSNASENETIRTEYIPTETDSSSPILPVRKSKRMSNRTLFGNLLLVATSSLLFHGQMQFSCITAFQSSLHLQTRASKAPSSLHRFMSLATPPSSIPSRSDLESMKVVDLKQLIKDFGFNERGLLSKLKKKQDLVEFLVEKAIPSTSNVETEQPPPPQQRQPRKVPMAMPKKAPPATATPAAASSSDDNNIPSTQNQKQSPMLELFGRVNKQYPTLQYLRDGNRTLYGELDIRQRYHPMLQAGNLQAIPDSESNPDGEAYKPALSGDLDLIFVGTASCTPSITRGVSCTALRLHSLASSSATSTKSAKISKGKKGQPQRFEVESNQSKNLGTWLFDCGESTQLQIQKTSSVRPSKITKIFLTHAHGDHSFGLPGLLCLMGQDTAGGNEAGERGPNGENIRKTKESKAPIEIYGPEGLRLWLRTAIRYSVSRIVPRYRVHELKDVAMAPEWGYSPKWEKYFFNRNAFHEMRNNNNGGNSNNNNNSREYYWGAANDVRKDSINDHRRRGQTSDWLSLCDQNVPGIQRSELYGEVEGGRDIYPIYDHPLSSDGAPVWEVEHEGGGEDGDTNPETGEPSSGVKVYAAPMSHGVPCVGYVVQEASRPGRLRDEFVKPICQRNVPALKEAGFRHPMKAMAVIKDLPEGGSFTFPDGTVVTQEEAVEPMRPGRKIVICGDTNSARALDKLAQNADVIVHESTNAFLPNYDHMNSNPASVNREAICHGHSTPQIAGDFAKRTGAKRLILNHFSARYMGDQSIESMSIMTRMEEQAIKASGLTRSHVAAAWDFMIFPIPKAYSKNDSGEEEETGLEN